MKYNIRQRVINQYGLPVVKVETVIGELGSGLLDCNGKEIFEGDIVRDIDGSETDIVVFDEGQFYLKRRNVCLSEWNDGLEVIGHVEDKK